MIWPYPPPLTHFSGFIHYFPPFHSAPASLAFLLSLEQIGHCSYIKFFALAVPMPRTSFLQSLMDFLILICIFSQLSLSVKSSLDNLSKLQYSSSLMFCDPFFPNISSLYHSSRRTICFPFFHCRLQFPKSIDVNPRTLLDLSNFKSTGLKILKRGLQRTLGGGRGVEAMGRKSHTGDASGKHPRSNGWRWVQHRLSSVILSESQVNESVGRTEKKCQRPDCVKFFIYRQCQHQCSVIIGI